LARPDPFDVVRPWQIEVSSADKILICANDKRLGLTNGWVLAVTLITCELGEEPAKTSTLSKIPAG
jgi:hypothetical protein